MVRYISVRSKDDLDKLARELEKQFTVVYTDDEHILAMRDGRIVRRFRVFGTITPSAPGGLNQLPQSGHVFLCYADEREGRRAEFQFLRAGLLKGEKCTYATHGSIQEAERDMAENRVPVREYRERNLLDICTIEDPFEDRDGWRVGIMKTIDRLTRAKSTRIVSRGWMRDISAKEQNLANREEERMIDAAIKGDVHDENFIGLRGFKGLLVCSYSVNDVPRQTQWSWLLNHLGTHDSAVFAGDNTDVLYSKIR